MIRPSYVEFFLSLLVIRFRFMTFANSACYVRVTEYVLFLRFKSYVFNVQRY